MVVGVEGCHRRRTKVPTGIRRRAWGRGGWGCCCKGVGEILQLQLRGESGAHPSPPHLSLPFIHPAHPLPSIHPTYPLPSFRPTHPRPSIHPTPIPSLHSPHLPTPLLFFLPLASPPLRPRLPLPRHPHGGRASRHTLEASGCKYSTRPRRRSSVPQ